MHPTATPVAASLDEHSPQRRSGLVALGVGTLALVAVALAVAAALRDGAQLGVWRWPLRPWRLAGASVIELGTLALGVWTWSRVLAGFDGAQPGYRGLLRAWRASTLAKYLPGSVWSTASTVEMAGRIGASPIALPSSFLIHGALNLAGALVVAALLARGSMAIALGASSVALALVHPRIVNGAVRLVARVAKRDAPAWTASWGAGALLLVLSVAIWIAYGAAFALLVSSLTPTAGVTWTTLAGINALAFAAGFVAFFAPGGIGVREAALVALLGTLVPGMRARVALAAASRLWLVLTELAGGALVGAVRQPRHRTSWSAPIEASPPPVTPRDRRPPVHRGVRVDLLTDTRAALADITAAFADATRSIWIAQLAFDADCAATLPNASGDPRTLLETIVDASRRLDPDGAPIDVRIVLNGGLLLDTSPALRRALAALGAGPNVQLRVVKAFPQVMHAKALVVDGADAFLMGASFVNGYWDDARHTAAGAAAAAPGTGDRPLHDVAVRLRGSAAGAVAEWFTELWRGAAPNGTQAAERVLAATPTVAGDCAVRLLRTLPDGAPTRAGRTEILDAYLEAIGRARSCIYLESQYFSARPVVRALRDALDANSALELIVVLNQNPDVTAYRAWQDARLAEHGLLEHARVGVFALWSATPSSRVLGLTELTQVFVHDKVAVIDDAWATIGTANLDGASLHSYGDDFAAWPGRRAFGRHRNFDLNVALLDGVDGEARTGVAADLRQRLWARHVGLPTHALGARPASGWLPLWRERASANVAALAAGGLATLSGHALPYAPHAHPRAQLGALGIDATRLDLRFDPTWLEVHCSPGWIAKLLPERVRRWL